jgi:hypothetical protein
MTSNNTCIKYYFDESLKHYKTEFRMNNTWVELTSFCCVLNITLYNTHLLLKLQ